MKSLKLICFVALALTSLCLTSSNAQGSTDFNEYCSKMNLGCEDETSFELILLAHYDCLECADRIRSYVKCENSTYFGVYLQKAGYESKRIEFEELMENASCVKWTEISDSDLFKLAAHVTGEEIGPYSVSVYKGRLAGVKKI